jgi:protein-disulfide isomerase
MPIYKLLALGGSLLLAASPYRGSAEPCAAPSPQQQAAANAYVTAKYATASSAGPNLVASGKANDACFWKLEYETAQKTRLVLYLSPDRNYLATELFDLKVDPLLEQRQKAEETQRAISAGDPPSAGPSDAPVTIVEFSDFECPYCQKLKDILEKEILPSERGKVRVAFRNFPLSMHPWAKSAALMASCASLQDAADFWKVHDFLFDNQRNLSADNITQKVTDFISTGTKLDKAQFQVCLDKELTLGIVTKDMTIGQQNGVRATPTIFVNGVRYQGVQNAPQLREIVDAATAGRIASATPPAVSQPSQCVRPASDLVAATK